MCYKMRLPFLYRCLLFFNKNLNLVTMLFLCCGTSFHVDGAEDSIAFMKKENHHSNTIQNVFYSSPPQVVLNMTRIDCTILGC